jgi:CO dehydrogenase maturation factor
VDVLLVITDPSARGLEVARTIAQVARKARTPRIGLVVNRARPDDDLDPRGLELLGLIPEDPKVSELDRLGNPLATLPDDSPCLGAARGILERIL